MEIQTIPALSMAGVICTIILSIGLPILLIVGGKKKFGAQISTFFIGAGTFVLFALVLEQILHMLVMNVLGLSQDSNEWLYYIYAAVAAAVFEESGRIIAIKYFMKSRFNFPNAFMYGVGHGGIEAIVLGGLTGISNLANMLMINSGSMETVLAALPDDVKNQTLTQISALWTTNSGLFFAAGIERVSALVLQIGLSLIIFNGLKTHKKPLVLLAYCIHFAVDFFAVACASKLPIVVVEIIIMIMAAGTLVFAHKLSRENLK
ncbi:MAG: YhfC family intramembrane metalloprotease [Lachnobacterium sp.]|nr:YhfC family intramembrane metalloprotease [Lachnobacterium sp.]